MSSSIDIYLLIKGFKKENSHYFKEFTIITIHKKSIHIRDNEDLALGKTFTFIDDQMAIEKIEALIGD